MSETSKLLNFMGLRKPFSGGNCMLGFSPKVPFFAVLVLEARFLSWLNQLIQIIFAVEWQFSPRSPTIVIRELLTGHGGCFFRLHSKSPLYDWRFTCKEEYRDAREENLQASDSFLLILISGIDLSETSSRWEWKCAKHKFSETLLCFWLLMNLWNGIWEFNKTALEWSGGTNLIIWLDLMILKASSNLNDSLILYYLGFRRAFC